MEEENEKRRNDAIKNSFLFKGPTVVAALVCAVAAVFSISVGTAIVTSPGALQGTFLVNLSTGNGVSRGLLGGFGIVLLVLGVIYVASAALLWSEIHWIKGVYVGIVASIIGMVWSGIGTTFAPGIAAAGMLVNVLIVTLLATETWEATRGVK
ncbi:MAG: hypothetical protein JRN21_03940 [Nitrososphaerota archaeon]|nr:hypothetical protein [Nitrososphaerota archaeon]